MLVVHSGSDYRSWRTAAESAESTDPTLVESCCSWLIRVRRRAALKKSFLDGPLCFGWRRSGFLRKCNWMIATPRDPNRSIVPEHGLRRCRKASQNLHTFIMRGSRHTHSHSPPPKTLTIVNLISQEIVHLV